VPVTHNGAAPLTGSGTLGTAVTLGSSVQMSGSGTVGAVALQAPLSAGASLSVLARVIKNASAALSASTALTASGTVPMMIARPALAATAKIQQNAVAALHASSALTAATSASAAHLAAAPVLTVPGRMGAARLLAGTSLTVSGRYFMPGQAALYAGTQLSAAAHVTDTVSSRLSASTAMAVSALLHVTESAVLSAAGHLTAATSASAAHLAAAPVLTVTGKHTANASAGLHAPGSVSAAAKATEHAAAAMHGSAALSGPAVLSRTARGHLSAAGTLTAAGAAHKTELGAAALEAAAALRAAGVRKTFGAASLASAAALSAHALRTAVTRAQLAAQAQVHAAGQDLPGARLYAAPALAGTAVLSRAGHGTLSAGAKLAGTAHGTAFPKAAFRAPGVFTPVPAGIVHGAAAFACSPSLCAAADTKPKLPFPVRPKGQQPTWQRDAQRWTVVQERQRHAQALWQYGELVMFALMWRPLDIGAGLAQRCTRCYTPAKTVSDIAPETALPLGWPTAATEAQISAAYGQGNQFRCTLCYGTQVIAARPAQVPGLRALLVRPAILTDTDQNQQRTAKGTVNTGQVTVQSTPDFRVNTLDYFFRSDGRRYQLAVPDRTTLRTGFASPWQASAGISYNLASAALEDPKASVAYVIPPPHRELASVLGTYTRVPADYAFIEQVNGPLIPEEEPPPAAYGFQQPSESLGV